MTSGHILVMRVTTRGNTVGSFFKKIKKIKKISKKLNLLGIEPVA
jgi:hypothetical protein